MKLSNLEFIKLLPQFMQNDPAVRGLAAGIDSIIPQLAAEVEKLIAARQAARSEKNWAEADRIRDVLKDMGIVIMDSKQGVQWKKA